MTSYRTRRRRFDLLRAGNPFKPKVLDLVSPYPVLLEQLSKHFFWYPFLAMSSDRGISDALGD
jgi:hypothetical protein